MERTQVKLLHIIEDDITELRVAKHNHHLVLNQVSSVVPHTNREVAVVAGSGRGGVLGDTQTPYK